MRGVQINKTALKRIADTKVGPIVYPILLKRVKKAVEAAHRQMLEEFEDHAVTQEIEGGIHANNSSGTLGGYGNLYSFIGFEDGTDPIAPVRALLEKVLNIKRLPTSHKSMIQTFIVELPSKEAIFNQSPMPWSTGKSWVEGIERGISGLGSYFAKQSNSSRSGGGFQSKTSNKGGSFSNTKYLSEILNNLQINIKRLAS